MQNATEQSRSADLLCFIGNEVRGRLALKMLPMLDEATSRDDRPVGWDWSPDPLRVLVEDVA